jgi:hypothetical protein
MTLVEGLHQCQEMVARGSNEARKHFQTSLLQLTDIAKYILQTQHFWF